MEQMNNCPVVLYIAPDGTTQLNVKLQEDDAKRRKKFYICRRVALFIFVLALCSSLKAQTTFCTDSLVEDFRYFIAELEQTHPDPYSRYGGRTMFSRAVEACETKMRSDSICTRGQLASSINAFLVPLHDGHTSVANPDTNPSQSTAMLCTPIKFRVLDDGLIVRAIDKEHSQSIGARLLEIEGIGADELVRRISSQIPSENKVGAYLNASWQLRNKEQLERCIGRTLNDSLNVTLLDEAEKKHNLALPFLTQDALRAMHYESSDSDLKLPKKNMAYTLLDEEGKTMYFRASAMYSRENIEYEYLYGMNSFADDLAYCYIQDQSVQPKDTEKAIAGLPSFSEEFYNMLQEMKRHGTQNLIIDLRGNQGGWTPIALPTLYQMWGNDYLSTDMNTSRHILISPRYMEKLNTTLEEFNAANGTHYEYGDYASVGSQETSLSEQNVEALISNRMMSCTKETLLAQKGRPVYTPKNVYVATDALTFSAAFHYAFYLWKMGAKIVGTSSSQAPNTFMEQTPLYLPRTNLFVSISNSVQMFLPADDPNAEMLVPDYCLTDKLYRKYGCDNNADIMYILNELIEK